MQYLQNKALLTIKEDWQGNPFDGKEFLYEDEPFRPKMSDIFKMLTSRNPQAREKRTDKWRPAVFTDSNYLESKEDFIVWLGHASFLIQLNGKRILTDPVFYNLALLRRFVPLPLKLEQFADLDYLLLSHDHRDHCDQKSIKNVLKHASPTILTSLKMSSIIGHWIGDTPIQEAGWYQVYQTEDIEVTFLPSQHWCRRGLTDFNQVLWGSFMIQANGKTIYFGGDSAKGKHFGKIKQLFPNIDICILGIGAYKPQFMMQPVHTNPQEAFEAYQQLGAKKMIPMHYGTYDLSWEPISEPYYQIQDIFEQYQLGDQVLPIGVGEAVFI